MTEPLLKITNVTKRFSGFTALDSVSLAVAPGERFGLIGPKGSGKSALMKCVMGTWCASRAARWRSPSMASGTISPNSRPRKSSTSTWYWCPKAAGCSPD